MNKFYIMLLFSKHKRIEHIPKLSRAFKKFSTEQNYPGYSLELSGNYILDGVSALYVNCKNYIHH